MRLLIVILFILPQTVFAQLQPSKVFTNNMVLQRDQPIRVWGKALPQQTIAVTFANQKKKSITKSDSSWSVYFPAQAATAVPQILVIETATQKIEINNVLIGDVWLCIGQSNMEFPMVKEMHFNEEKEKCNLPQLRFYNPDWAGKGYFNTSYNDSVVQLLNPEKFYQGNWQISDSNTVKKMSAVGYYFGKEILKSEMIPIGIINLSIGGAPLETFISTSKLLQSKQFAPKVKSDWLLNDALPVWIRERGAQSIGSLKNVPTDENGKFHAYKPSAAYNAGIKSLIPFAIKGVLNYQGESNAQEIERVNEYAALSKLMIDDYRQQWKQPALPYYFVQLSSIDSLRYGSQLWPQFRNEQRKMLAILPNSGMAVCSDIGNIGDVHPTNKKMVGERLARWALSKTYKKNIVPSGPLPIKAIFLKDKVIVSFQYVANSLETSDSWPPTGFSIDGLKETQAEIKDDNIVIPVKIKPEFIYYGWKPYSTGNLVNSENLPASTFKIKVQ